MATFAETMLAALETTLTSNPGVRTITVDGQTVTYDSLADMLAHRNRLKTETARANRTRPRCASIKLTNHP